LPIELDRKALAGIRRDIVATEAVKRMTRVRDACRAQSGTDEYMLSIEGPGAIELNAVVTVITAGPEAIRDNAENNTLVRNFHLAGG
jgi:hypothetical protein